jgi:twitching motility protein PilU
VLRLINSKIPTHRGARPAAGLKDIVLTKRGLVILVGGTGSGKSTSLAAMVGYRNEKTRGHIVTIEDPVEYVHQHKGCVITHREIGVDTDELGRGAEEHPAPGAGRDPDRRDPRPRDHGIRHPVRRDRPPRAGDAARQQRQPGARPHHQLLPGRAREQLLMDLSLNIRAP